MLGAIISGVSSIAGAALGSRANKKAARKAGQAAYAAANERNSGIQQAADTTSAAIMEAANQRISGVQRGTDEYLQYQDWARSEYRNGLERGIAAIRQGTQRLEELTAEARNAPAEFSNQYYRLGLTPNQTIARDDLLRRSRQSIAASGLRGAGRAGAAAILDADRRFLAQAAENNTMLNRQQEAQNIGYRQQAALRRDNANLTLGNATRQDAAQQANLQQWASGNIANNLSQSGQMAGRGAEMIGRLRGEAIEGVGSVRGAAQQQTSNNRASAMEVAGGANTNASQANAALWGNTIGNIAAVGRAMADRWSQDV
jgi:hypothetical protein